MCSGICLRRRNKAWRHSTERRYHPSCSNMFHDPSNQTICPKNQQTHHVFRAFCPRVRPSVPSMAMVRTMFSPVTRLSLLQVWLGIWLIPLWGNITGIESQRQSLRRSHEPLPDVRPTAKTLPKCWATSKTKRCSKPSTCRMTHFPIHVKPQEIHLTSKALRMGGNAESNWTWGVVEDVKLQWLVNEKQSLGCILLQIHWSTIGTCFFQSSNQPWIRLLLLSHSSHFSSMPIFTNKSCKSPTT